MMMIMMIIIIIIIMLLVIIIMQLKSSNYSYHHGHYSSHRHYKTKVFYTFCFQFTILDDGIAVTFPAMSRVASQWAWVLVFHGIEPA